MNATTYSGWMRAIAAAHTAVELAALERRLQRFPANAARDQLADLCAVRRGGLVSVPGRACVLAGRTG